MAESSAEKTEQPTAKKLRDARKRGQVSKSKDVVSTALVISLCLYFGSAWATNVEKLERLITMAPLYYTAPFEDALLAIIRATFATGIVICLPFIAIAIGVAIFANFIQVGPVFAPEAVKPDLKKLDPIAALKKMFSVKSMVEFLKSTIKVIVIGLVLYYVIQIHLDPMIKVPMLGLRGLMDLLGPLMWDYMIYIFIVYIALAAFDFFFQKKEFIKEQRMTKDEVKREYKESEGSPEIKSKRKQIHQEIVQESATQNTKKSTVLITNPTHYAVAVLYEMEKTQLPVVTAKGEGWLALTMMKAAKEANVPIMRNVPLAQALYREVPISEFVPSDLMQALAEVLIEVNRLKLEGLL
jgi:type III secretion protein U